MSNVKVICDKEDIVEIADAVRAKTGSVDTMSLNEIVTNIESISGGSNSSDPVEVVSTDGVAYTVTTNQIKATNLTELKGQSLVIIPNMTSTSASNVSLDVNGLGAKAIKRWDNRDTSEWWSFTSANWFKAGYPIRVMFNGDYWIIEGMNKPVAADLNGTVSISNGGTGATTAAAARTSLGAAAASDLNSKISSSTIVAQNLVSTETTPTENGVINWIYG